MRLRATTLLGCIVLAGLPAPAGAQSDWFARLYTQEGVELRADERLFALYAVLNAMGYDEAPVVRSLPVPSREMHPVRTQVRGQVTLDPALQQKIGAFFDSHQKPADAYGRYALSLKDPSSFERLAGSPADLKGFESLLAEAWSQAKLSEAFGRVAAEYRGALKGYHAAVDAPVGSVLRLLRAKEDEPPRVILVVNLLEGAGKAYSARMGEELFVVIGPSKTPDLFLVAREVARARLAPVIEKAGAKAWAEQATAAGVESASEYATEVLARAFAAAAVKLPEAQLAAQSSGAWAPVRAIARSVEGFASTPDKSLEAFVAETLAPPAAPAAAPVDGKGPKPK